MTIEARLIRALDADTVSNVQYTHFKGGAFDYGGAFWVSSDDGLLRQFHPERESYTEIKAPEGRAGVLDASINRLILRDTFDREIFSIEPSTGEARIIYNADQDDAFTLSALDRGGHLSIPEFGVTGNNVLYAIFDMGNFFKRDSLGNMIDYVEPNPRLVRIKGKEVLPIDLGRVPDHIATDKNHFYIGENYTDNSGNKSFNIREVTFSPQHKVISVSGYGGVHADKKGFVASGDRFYFRDAEKHLFYRLGRDGKSRTSDNIEFNPALDLKALEREYALDVFTNREGRAVLGLVTNKRVSLYEIVEKG